jgi:hypothetical protein
MLSAPSPTAFSQSPRGRVTCFRRGGGVSPVPCNDALQICADGRAGRDRYQAPEPRRVVPANGLEPRGACNQRRPRQDSLHHISANAREQLRSRPCCCARLNRARVAYPNTNRHNAPCTPSMCARSGHCAATSGRSFGANDMCGETTGSARGARWLCAHLPCSVPTSLPIYIYLYR